MRILVTGAGGMLGHDIVAAAPRNHDVLPRTRAQLDITDADAVRDVLGSVQPDVVINCAAYTSVDRAESERDRAATANAVAPGTLGHACSTQQAHRTPHVIHFSTDYVFDGASDRPYREDDPTGALNVYGQTKLTGEAALQESGSSYVILRTSWLYGLSGKSFPRAMWQRACAGQASRVVDDQWGRPTSTDDLASATWRLVEKMAQETTTWERILHVSNGGQPVTWYGIAKHIFARAGRPELVTPCATKEYQTLAQRPMWSVLDTTLFDDLAGPLPEWPDALDRFLNAVEVA